MVQLLVAPVVQVYGFPCARVSNPDGPSPLSNGTSRFEEEVPFAFPLRSGSVQTPITLGLGGHCRQTLQVAFRRTERMHTSPVRRDRPPPAGLRSHRPTCGGAPKTLMFAVRGRSASRVSPAEMVRPAAIAAARSEAGGTASVGRGSRAGTIPAGVPRCDVCSRYRLSFARPAR